MAKKEDKPKITPDMQISELALEYPDIAEYLTTEYGFHCVNCFLAEWESIEEGAAVHGIWDDEFEELMKELNEMAEKQNLESRI